VGEFILGGWEVLAGQQQTLQDSRGEDEWLGSRTYPFTVIEYFSGEWYAAVYE